MGGSVTARLTRGSKYSGRNRAGYYPSGRYSPQRSSTISSGSHSPAKNSSSNYCSRPNCPTSEDSIRFQYLNEDEITEKYYQDQKILEEQTLAREAEAKRLRLEEEQIKAHKQMIYLETNQYKIGSEGYEGYLDCIAKIQYNLIGNQQLTLEEMGETEIDRMIRMIK